MHTHVTDRRGSSSAASGAAAAARTIDELLFEPGSWRALDAANTQVPGVRAGALADALALVGRGAVATVYGRLRAGVAVVDVDMARGAPVVAELVAWCAERSLWHVARPSGRAGHAHVFVVTGDQAGALEQFCGQLRAAHRVSRGAIDVRATIRPLSAPHRSGATPPLPPRLPSAARALRGALGGLTGGVTDSPRPVTQIHAQQPPLRARRAVPAGWADYMASGIPPAQCAGWADASRSAVESTATWQMAAAGWTADQAWLAISRAHPRAFTKARSKGQRWWTACVWNRAVDALRRQPPQAAHRADPSPQDELADQVEALRGAFLACWTTCYPDPRRHTLRRVLDVLLDRMRRVSQSVVPCPQRDLVADTGLSRPTVAAALQALHDDGWIVLERTFDLRSDTREARSHHARLPDRLPRSAPQGEVLSPSLPPSSFTPRPAGSPPPTTAALLGPRLWHLYLALLASPTPPMSPPDVAHEAGWTASGAEALSSRAQRSVLTGLVRLAAAGLAVCDEYGRWTAHDLDHLSPATAEAAADGYRQRAEEIGAERAAYALARAGRRRWHTQREQAIQRGAAARQVGAHRWWISLDPAEQTSRRQAWAAQYRALPPAEQGRVKHELAHRRHLAGGLSEDQLHQAWLGGLSEAEYHSRAAERTIWYRSLDPPTQRALVGMWEQHRDTWGIQRRSHSPITRAMSPEQRAGELLRLDQAVAAAYDVLEAELGALSVITVTQRRRQDSA